jgi:hypothetical protein
MMNKILLGLWSLLIVAQLTGKYGGYLYLFLIWLLLVLAPLAYVLARNTKNLQRREVRWYLLALLGSILMQPIIYHNMGINAISTLYYALFLTLPLGGYLVYQCQQYREDPGAETPKVALPAAVKARILAAVANNQLKSALATLEPHVGGTAREATFRILQREWNELKRQELRNTVSPDAYTAHMNRLTERLLLLVEG